MLSLRMIIVAGIAGICLWGLFNLLDNLKEPDCCAHRRRSL